MSAIEIEDLVVRSEDIVSVEVDTRHYMNCSVSCLVVTLNNGRVIRPGAGIWLRSLGGSGQDQGGDEMRQTIYLHGGRHRVIFDKDERAIVQTKVRRKWGHMHWRHVPAGKRRDGFVEEAREKQLEAKGG